MPKHSIIIVGGGLAGMAAAMKLAELGCEVGMMSLLPPKRSHSVCAQGGINSVNDLTRQLGDNEWKHFEDTVYGGDFLQHQPPVKELADWAPRIIDLMDRLGVTFNRTPEGFRDQRRFGGTLYRRTAFAGATTGQQLLYALDEQVRRWEVAGKIRKYESWDFLGPILDEQSRCRGCVAQDMITMEIRAFPADALVLATGGCGLLFGRSTNSMACTGSAASRMFQAGAREVHMRPACPPLVYGCKFLNFSRSRSELDLAARKAIKELEGDDGKHLEDYAEPTSARHAAMVERIRQQLGLTSLRYQKLGDLVAAIGLPKSRLCTYCWDGAECCCEQLQLLPLGPASQ